MWHPPSYDFRARSQVPRPAARSAENTSFIRAPPGLSQHFSVPPPMNPSLPRPFMYEPPPSGRTNTTRPPVPLGSDPDHLFRPPPAASTLGLSLTHQTRPAPARAPYPPPVTDLSHPPPAGSSLPPGSYNHPPLRPVDCTSAPPQRVLLAPAPPVDVFGAVDSSRSLPNVEAADLLRDVSGSIKDEICPSADGQRWVTHWAQKTGILRKVAAAAEKKAPPKLSELRDALSGAAPSASAAADLARLVRRRRKRRAALRLRRQESRQRVLRRHAEIDAWQADIRRQVEKAQQAERLREEADKVLGEVRRKISNVETHIQTLDLLRTLRETRDMKARQSGLFTSAESDQKFADVTARLTQLLDRHLMTYEGELRTLSSMACAQGDPQPPPSPPGAAPAVAALKTLFGAEGVSEAAAEAVERQERDCRLVHMVDWDKRPQQLIKIRSSWDQYLVSADDPLGSSIPPCWVVPVAPSSACWATSLAE